MAFVFNINIRKLLLVL